MCSVSSSADLTARARIRDAAIELFADRGFERGTVKAIAEAADVSPGLVIHHYGSKEALRNACDEHVIASLITDPFTAVAGASPDLMQTLIARAAEAGPQFRYLTRLLSLPGAAGDGLFALLVASTEEHLAAGREDGTVRPATDPEATALIVTAFGLAQLLVRDRFTDALGVDPLSPEGARRLTVPTLELLTDGLYANPDLLKLARTAVERPESPPPQTGED